MPNTSEAVAEGVAFRTMGKPHMEPGFLALPRFLKRPSDSSADEPTLKQSDSHSPGLREAGLSAAAAEVGGDLGHWLTSAAPTALLAGAPLPERPDAKRRPFRRRRLRR